MGDFESYSTIRENRSLKKLFFLLFGIVALVILYIFRSFFWPFLFGVISYIALRSINDYLIIKVKNRSLASSITVIAAVLVILLPAFFLLLTLADQLFQFYLSLENKLYSGFFQELKNNEYVVKILAYFDLNIDTLVKESTRLIKDKAGVAFSNLTALLSFPLSFTIDLAFMLLMLFFLLKDGSKLDKVIYKALPFPDDIEEQVVNRLKSVVKLLLAGNFFMMVLQGIMLGIGFFIADLRMPLLWGSVGAIVSLIPVGGTIFVWLPACIYLIFTNSIGTAIFLAIWSFFWFVFFENLVKPKVFGERLNFHPVVFFFLLLGSIQTFNLPGVIIGPLLLTLYHSLWEIYRLLQQIDVPSSEDSTS